MKIIGFNLTKILIEKKEKKPEKLEINQNIDIKNIIKETIHIGDEEVLKISFVLTINYSQDYAKLEFEGNIITIPTKEELEESLKEWKKNKIPDNFRIPLFNFIMSKCNIKAISLEDELGIPIHLPLPKLKINKPKE